MRDVSGRLSPFTRHSFIDYIFLRYDRRANLRFPFHVSAAYGAENFEEKSPKRMEQTAGLVVKYSIIMNTQE
jgi:hypothetical protein